MKTKSVKLKTYLEGIEVPITSINITERINSAPVATVNLPALPEFTKLLPKTLIHVFYETHLEDEYDGEEKFYLIFEGELSGVSFGRSQGGAGIQLTFSGLTSNWKNTYKAIVDFSLDTFSRSNFLLIGGPVDKNKVKDKYSDGISDDGSKLDLENNANWMIGVIPGVTIINRLQRALSNFFKKDSKNALQSTIVSFIKSLATSNPYYRMIDYHLQVSKRIKVLENKQLKETLKGEVVSELLTQNFRSMPNTTTGSELLKHILNKLEYFYVEPSAPTDMGGYPGSVFLTPDTTFMMPLKCNTIFQDQIISSNYSQNFLGEPTRLVANTPPVGLSDSTLGKSYSMSAKFIAPQDKLFGQIRSKEDKDSETYEFEKMPALSMSKEEMMRGVQPQIYQYNDAQLAYASFIRKGKSASEIEKDGNPKQTINDFKDEQNGPTKYIKSINNYEYYKRYYSPRSFTVSTTYSPHRMVGFPALVLDEALPSVVGKISSIRSDISSDGACTSQITIDGARHYNAYKGSDNEEDVDGFAKGFYDSKMDKWPNVGFWIDRDSYSPDNIGETMKSITKPEDKNYIATVDGYAEDSLKKKSWVSSDIINLIGNVIKRLIEKRKWYKEPHLFADREIQRNLMSEDAFWKFLLKKDEDKSVDDPSYSRKIKNMEYKLSERIITEDGKDIISGNPRPFVLERQEKVKEIINKIREVF